MIKRLAIHSFLMFTFAGQAFAGADPHHGDGYHAEASGGLPQLDPSSFSSQIFWLTVFFLIVYVFFSRKSLPEISQTIESRSERIQNDLDSAERLKEEVASVQTSYEESLKSAREESSKTFKVMEEEIKQKTEDQAKKFQEVSTKKIQELEKSIAAARDAAMEDMSQIAADVATEAAEKIIGVRADTKSVKAVVNSINKAA